MLPPSGGYPEGAEGCAGLRNERVTTGGLCPPDPLLKG